MKPNVRPTRRDELRNRAHGSLIATRRAGWSANSRRAVFSIVALLLLSAASTVTLAVPGVSSGQGSIQTGVQADSAASQAAEEPSTNEESSFFSRIFGSDQERSLPPEVFWLRAARIGSRLVLAALLATTLAFRPRRSLRLLHRNPYVAQTQILLAVVASSLMMIVADNAARAFGIFAAASLVRFRTNIRDPKETTVLLINLAIGLASGVGRWEVAIVLSVFVLALLWALEYQEASQVLRAMELKVKTSDVDATEHMLREVFDKHGFTAEVRELDRQDEQEPMGKIVYYVSVNSAVSTDRLSEEILSSDAHNIDSIEWHQKKSSYVYR